MPEKKYKLTFTVGAGLIAESTKTAELYSDYLDWQRVREHVLQENTFQARTQNTLIKLYREVHRRLSFLSDEELALLAKGSEADKRHLVWVAICLNYRLIRDFANEVTRVRYDSAQYQLAYSDYDLFFDDKSEVHENLNHASVSTKKKARQVIFKMMAECGLIDDEREIRPQILSDAFCQATKNAGHDDFGIFPGAGRAR